jgi:hypothetical protein
LVFYLFSNKIAGILLALFFLALSFFLGLLLNLFRPIRLEKTIQKYSEKGSNFALVLQEFVERNKDFKKDFPLFALMRIPTLLLLFFLAYSFYLLNSQDILLAMSFGESIPFIFTNAFWDLKTFGVALQIVFIVSNLNFILLALILLLLL